jgi:PKD repeat protein
MNALANALLGLAAAGALLLALPHAAVSQSQPTTATSLAPSAPILFGMDSASIAAESAAGVKPDYGTFWIGPWTLTSGWGGPDAQLDSMRNAGVTPAIHFYYWGDDISPSCLENGCWSSLHNAQKDQAHWQVLADQLVAHLDSRMQGRPVLVFLETEFNKGSVATYEPLDGYLAAKADQIHAGYPAAKVVMALGNWGQAYWPTWDRTAAASDFVGVQGMRGSTRQSASDYRTLYEKTVEGARTAKADFGKPVVVQDFALSTYPEPDWLALQHDELKQFFDSRDELHSVGVQAIIYRSWKDAPNMDTNNYYGEAERHFGLAWPDGTLKPAGQVWIDGVKAERAGISSATTTTSAGPQPIAVAATGGSAEADAFATRTAGGLQSDSAAAGGKAWNLWSNGHVQQSFDVAPGTYDVSVRARGTALGGVAPHMVATLGGTTVTADPGTSYADSTVRLALGGPFGVQVAFTNDAKSSTEDRNLVVDQVRFTPVPSNRAPVAAFGASAADLAVSVDASATTDPDGDALSYAWDFGDGATAVGKTASHAYAAAGTYTVTLTASDSRLQGSASQAVTAVQPNRPPVAAFTASMDLLTATVDASASSDADGDALAYAWDFGDGVTASGRSASHAYAGAGPYTIVLTVSDGEAAASASQAVQAIQPDRAPVASFSATASQLALAVDASGSSDPDGDPLSYSWSFGDGATAAGKTAGHAYAKGGTYTATLTVGDGTMSAQASRTVTVTAPAPTTSSSSSGPYAATFTVKSASSEWWQQVKVGASPAPTRVQMSVDGGAWQAMTLQSYGDWTSSVHVVKGSKVVFRATAPDGRMATSPTLTWLGAASSSTTSTPSFSASFAPKAVGNDWWVEAAVTGNQPVAKVEAKVGSGAWTQLALQDWGNYAKSVNAPNGSQVTFRATSTAGATATSAPVTWT